jgi:NADPH:quinone reductase-like Zn-dependent oxidoreductase
MLALQPTDSSDPPVEMREIPEPLPARHEALVRVEAFSGCGSSAPPGRSPACAS